MEIKSYFTTITPEEAKKLLEKNYAKNRNLKPSVVTKYASDMMAGRWNPYAADAITFASDMTILNGQHRLAAIVKSGVPLYTEVRWGVSEDAYKYFDCGATRTAGDALPRTLKNRTCAAALCKLAITMSDYDYINGVTSFNTGRNKTISTANVVTYYEASEEKYPGEIAKACEYAYTREILQTKWSPTGLAMSAYAMSITDTDKFEEFKTLTTSKISGYLSVMSFKTWALKHDTRNYPSTERYFFEWCAAANVWRMLCGHPDKEFRARKDLSGELIGFSPKMFRLLDE